MVIQEDPLAVLLSKDHGEARWVRSLLPVPGVLEGCTRHCSSQCRRTRERVLLGENYALPLGIRKKHVFMNAYPPPLTKLPKRTPNMLPFVSYDSAYLCAPMPN